jgi:membrane protease YdiL (CAAX protease family)
VGIDATTEIAVTGGPFAKAAWAIEHDGRIRDELARAFPVPSVRAWRTARIAVLVLAAAPALMLLELDRELVAAGTATAGRLLVDGFLTAWLGWELTRATPRVPGAAAAAILGIAIRWILVAARLCGTGITAGVWAAAILAVLAMAVLVGRAPARARVVLELEDAVGISRVDAVTALLPPDAPGKLVAAAAIAGAGLPAILLVLRQAHAGLVAQAIAFVAFAAIVPPLVRRTLDPAPRAPVEALRADVLFLAVAGGLALACGLMSGAHWFFDAGSEIARCTGRLDAEAKRLIAIEAEEIRRSLMDARASTPMILFTVVVVPFVEERVYRGLVMDVLVRKYGQAYGLFASAVIFGIAHIGGYDVALYQTVLLGLAFGVAYAEGGLVAAFAVHAAWNLLRIV